MGENARGDLQVAQALPERADLVRLAKSVVLTTEAVACVDDALPTTTAPAYVWNGEDTVGASYVIDRIIWRCTTSAGAASPFQLAVTLSTGVLTQPATTSTVVSSSLDGTAYAGKAGIGKTATIVDYKWFPIGEGIHTGAITATVGYALDVQINGLIIVPPGYLLGLACIAANTTAVGTFHVVMHEVQMVSGKRY